MRLLNSSTLQLEDFSPLRVPPYAILSHRWYDGEVLFEDMANGQPQKNTGYQKITGACEKAKSDGLEYLWVDTCCIDKRSSAELSEAINSMYEWYRKAEICYAYLADVSDGVDAEIDEEFARSEWFKRGWTLQELVAPEEVVFFSNGWRRLADKRTLSATLEKITKIDIGILNGTMDLRSLSVAKRMSWAAHRQTTRPEDIAYCLMGIFDVNMAMLYGEGEKAFIRLQEAIMQDSDDETLFAWIDESADSTSPHGLLATSPAAFARSWDMTMYSDWYRREPFSKTNKGLRISLRLCESESEKPYWTDGVTIWDGRSSARSHEDVYLTAKSDGVLIAALNCPALPGADGYFGICLKRAGGDHEFVRIRVNEPIRLDRPAEVKPQFLYVRSTAGSQSQRFYPESILDIRSWPSADDGYSMVQYLGTHLSPPRQSEMTWPSVRRKPSTRQHRSTLRFALKNKEVRLAAVLVLERTGDGTRFAILFGSSPEYGVAIDVCEQWNNQTFDDLSNSFRPHPPESKMQLSHETIWVNIETSTSGRRLYSCADVAISVGLR